MLFRGLRCAEMLRRDQFYASAWRPALIKCRDGPRSVHVPQSAALLRQLIIGHGAPTPAVAGHLGDTVETVSKVYLHWLRDDRSVPRIVLDRLLGMADESAAVAGT